MILSGKSLSPSKWTRRSLLCLDRNNRTVLHCQGSFFSEECSLRKFHVCKRYDAKLGEQVTAQLPVVRVFSDGYRIIYPFAAVGLDYFGLFYVKSGPKTRSRKNATPKERHGCIFTCLRRRAVLIEVAEDLSTDSFINPVLRFVGKRGPRELFTVITILVSEEPSWTLWDQERIQATLTKGGIEWKFNPPTTGHQQGVWERLIRLIRRILLSLIAERLLNDEALMSET